MRYHSLHEVMFLCNSTLTRAWRVMLRALTLARNASKSKELFNVFWNSQRNFSLREKLGLEGWSRAKLGLEGWYTCKVMIRTVVRVQFHPQLVSQCSLQHCVPRKNVWCNGTFTLRVAHVGHSWNILVVVATSSHKYMRSNQAFSASPQALVVVIAWCAWWSFSPPSHQTPHPLFSRTFCQNATVPEDEAEAFQLFKASPKTGRQRGKEGADLKSGGPGFKFAALNTRWICNTVSLDQILGHKT